MDPTTGALIVAALSVLATPFTAWLSYRWGREQEKERHAHERATEEERWQRDERTRRIQRGEDAAGRLLELVDEVTANFKDDQEKVKPTYIEMRRRAELLTDDAARDRMFEVAQSLYLAHQAKEADHRLTDFLIGSTASEAAHDVIRAYLHGRPMPELKRFDRLRVLNDQGSEIIFNEHFAGEWEDPLDEPNDDPDNP